jgi:alcohol dehydrogenase
MRAVVFTQFGSPLHVTDLDAPVPEPHGAVIEVRATGVCRSDWHGWQGHDPDVAVPHVPGHEFAGVVAAVGDLVTMWQPGDRVTVPFVCACGTCEACVAGEHQVCENQTQPGFTHHGSFAELVRIDHADVNLVRLPDGLDFVPAAALGCRFATAFRAVCAHGELVPGQWLAVHGCGGVGLSAVMIATALGAQVVAIDVSEAALALAQELGAVATVDAGAVPDVGARVVELTDGGAHVSIDAFGSEATCAASIESLRRRGRHVQVGLLPEALGRPRLPMARVVWLELSIHGSHGMAAHEYERMLAMVADGTLRPDLLVTDVIGLDDAPDALAAMTGPTVPGTRVIVP